MADRPDRTRRAEVPLPPMPAAWREPAEDPVPSAPRPPSMRRPAVPPPPRPPVMRSPVVPPPPVKPGYYGMPIAPATYPVPPRAAQRYMPPSYRTTAIPVSAPGTRPVSAPGTRPLSPIPYPGLPASAPPVHAVGTAHPFGDEQMSDRSGAVAGALQLLLGWVGAGRLYTGHVAIALMQLGVVWTVVLFTMCLGFAASQVWVLTVLGLTWPVVDGVILMCGGQRDSQGRPLR